MSGSDLAELDRNALIALILKLQAEVEALKRSGNRQAVPFSKGTRAKDPKHPGRKPGEGSFKTREAPAPETLSEPPIDVPTVEAECPKCGGQIDEGRVEEASITDLPEVVRPRMRLFHVRVRRCKRCRATNCRPENFTSVDEGLYGHVTRRNLAFMAEGRGDLADARRHWEAVRNAHPGDPDPGDALERIGRVSSPGGPR